MVSVNRNSTLQLSTFIDSSLISAEDVTLAGNSTVDLGIRTGLLRPSGSLIVNSGAVQVGLGTLPALPAVIEGTDEFLFDDAEIVLDQSDEALTFDVFFRHVGGTVTNNGTILFNGGADIGPSAMYDTGGFGRLVNGAHERVESR